MFCTRIALPPLTGLVLRWIKFCATVNSFSLATNMQGYWDSASYTIPWPSQLCPDTYEMCQWQDYQGLSTTPLQRVEQLSYNVCALPHSMNMTALGQGYNMEVDDSSARSQVREHHQPEMEHRMRGGAGVSSVPRGAREALRRRSHG